MKQLLIDWYEGLHLWSLKTSDPDDWREHVLRLLHYIVQIFSQIFIGSFLVKTCEVNICLYSNSGHSSYGRC